MSEWKWEACTEPVTGVTFPGFLSELTNRPVTLPQRVHDEFVLCGVGPRAKRVALFNIKVYAVALYADPFSFSARLLTMDPELSKRDIGSMRGDPRFYKMLISSTFSCCFALQLVRGLSKAQLASGFSEELRSRAVDDAMIDQLARLVARDVAAGDLVLLHIAGTNTLRVEFLCAGAGAEGAPAGLDTAGAEQKGKSDAAAPAGAAGAAGAAPSSSASSAVDTKAPASASASPAAAASVVQSAELCRAIKAIYFDEQSISPEARAGLVAHVPRLFRYAHFLMTADPAEFRRLGARSRSLSSASQGGPAPAAQAASASSSSSSAAAVTFPALLSPAASASAGAVLCASPSSPGSPASAFVFASGSAGTFPAAGAGALAGAGAGAGAGLGVGLAALPRLVARAGYLCKCSPGLFQDRWPLRFFILTGTMLTYRLSPESDLRGALDLAHCSLTVEREWRAVEPEAAQEYRQHTQQQQQQQPQPGGGTEQQHAQQQQQYDHEFDALFHAHFRDDGALAAAPGGAVHAHAHTHALDVDQLLARILGGDAGASKTARSASHGKSDKSSSSGSGSGSSSSSSLSASSSSSAVGGVQASSSGGAGSSGGGASGSGIGSGCKHIVFQVTSTLSGTVFRLSAEPREAAGWLRAVVAGIRRAQREHRALRARFAGGAAPAPAPAPAPASMALSPGPFQQQQPQQPPQDAAGSGGRGSGGVDGSGAGAGAGGARARRRGAPTAGPVSPVPFRLHEAGADSHADSEARAEAEAGAGVGPAPVPARAKGGSLAPLLLALLAVAAWAALLFATAPGPGPAQPQPPSLAPS